MVGTLEFRVRTDCQILLGQLEETNQFNRTRRGDVCVKPSMVQLSLLDVLGLAGPFSILSQ